jgi:putative oxidoreductase
MKKILFGTAPESSNSREFSLTFLRVFTGLSMAFSHGIGKVPPQEMLLQGVAAIGFPMPEFFAWAAGLSEFAGGILLALGLFTRPSAAFLAFTMGVAAIVVHAADPFAKKELGLLYFSIALVFTVRGSGRWSVDNFIKNKS